MASQEDVLRALEEQYLFLDTNFNDLFGRCVTDDERDQLRREYVAARDTYWEARHRVFVTNDPLLPKLLVEFSAAQQEVERAAKEAQTAAQVLSAIGTAVGIAGK